MSSRVYETTYQMKLDPRLFPDIQVGHVESKDKSSFVDVYDAAMKKNRRLMLTGESSIGKSTNLRLLEAYLLSRSIPTVLIECKNIRSSTQKEIEELTADYPKSTVFFD